VDAVRHRVAELRHALIAPAAFLGLGFLQAENRFNGLDILMATRSD
jgi:hypothetical protein